MKQEKKCPGSKILSKGKGKGLGRGKGKGPMANLQLNSGLANTLRKFKNK